MPTLRRCLLLATLALSLWCLAPAAPLAQACPNCKTMMDGEGDDAAQQQSQLGRGMSYSIYIMLAMPYVLVGSFGAAVWWTMRRHNARQVQPQA